MVVVVDVYVRMRGEGKVDGKHAYKFEGSLIALRSDSLQIYTGGVCVFKWGKPRERIERKDTPPPGAFWLSGESVVWLNKSNEKREKEEGKT